MDFILSGFDYKGTKDDCSFSKSVAWTVCEILVQPKKMQKRGIC